MVLEDFAHLIGLSSEIGLEINPRKCELHFSSGQIDNNVIGKFNALAPGMRVVANENFNLLGVAILNSDFHNMSLLTMENVNIMFDSLKNLQAHSALECILNINLENRTWIQTTLSTTFKGLGIRQRKDIAPKCQHQKEWDEINVMRIIEEELDFGASLGTAKFKALKCKKSNAWINANPSKLIGTLLYNNSIRICIALRIGAPICQPHFCLCGTFVDEYGIHGLSCKKSARRIPRHIEFNTWTD